MSISYQSKDDKVLSIALKVQEVCLTNKDSIQVADGGDLLVSIGEKVEEVRMAMHVQADGTVIGIDKADITLVDSLEPDPLAPAAPGDSKKIRFAGLTLADDDALVVKYVVAE